MPAKPIGGALPIETELLAEKSSALGRTAERFERSLAAYQALRTASDVTTDSAVEHEARTRQARDAAREALWFFLVQREALGLRLHEPVFAAYQIPDEIRRHMGPRRAAR